MILTSNRRYGFSLIELMVSMAIGSVIVLAAAAMLGNSGTGYERISGGLAAEREARTLIIRLIADLATARFHKDGIIEQSTATWPAARLGCLCLHPTQAQSEAGSIGDLCAVNYYIKDLTIGGKTVRCLMRGCRESKETFTALEADMVGSLFIPHNPGDEPVAFGVVAFDVSPKSRDKSGHLSDWTKNDLTGPDALQVSLVLARRDLAAKLRRPSDWDGVGAAGRLLGRPVEAFRNANLEVFTTLIAFGSHDHPQTDIP